MTFALYSRVLQFRAGPESHQFFACAEHRPALERGDHDGCFFGVDADVIAPVDPNDEIACDYCREGGD